MTDTKIEPLRPVIAILARRMKAEFPQAVAFDDRQEWTWPPQEGVPPGNWALVVGVSGGDTACFEPVEGIHGLYARVVTFTGPPRAFLTGWDPGQKEPVCVSTELWRVED
jgi:hypothetical protein